MRAYRNLTLSREPVGYINPYKMSNWHVLRIALIVMFAGGIGSLQLRLFTSFYVRVKRSVLTSANKSKAFFSC